MCVANMEIMSAVAECGDKRLQAKFKHSLNVVDRTLALYRFEEVAFSFNGGKDSTVLLHLLRTGFASAAMRSSSMMQGPCSATPHSITTIYFESPDAFPEIDTFTLETAKMYNLELKEIRLDFKSGIEELLREKPIKAIFLGTRIGDPNAAGQEKFSPSSAGWPPFMRVNPILDWSYRDVWAFLLACKVPYCKLYDRGYTSIGSVHDTLPNGALRIGTLSQEEREEQCTAITKENCYRPAYLLRDGRLERAGRTKKPASKGTSRPSVADKADFGLACANTLYAASVLVVGDEILRGELEDHAGTYLSQELHSIGWAITRRAVLPNDIDAISEEVEQRAGTNDIVLIAGGVGPIHSDVTLAGVAKAFGVFLATDEEFEEDLRQQIGDHCTGDQNKMAKLPEGITELLQHKDLPVPVIKCRNVFVLLAATRAEIEVQWRCLLELSKEKNLFRAQYPFASVRLCTAIPEVEIAGPLSQVDSDYPDLTIGCYRESALSGAVKGNWNVGRLVLSIIGKSADRVMAAAKALKATLPPDAVVELRDE